MNRKQCATGIVPSADQKSTPTNLEYLNLRVPSCCTLVANLWFMGYDQELCPAPRNVRGEVRSAGHIQRRIHLVTQEPCRALGAVHRERQRQRRESLLTA